MSAEVSRRGFLENAVLGAGALAALPVVFRRPAAAQDAAAPHAHPLDPLTADEIAAASQILNAANLLTQETRFVSTALFEPAKKDLTRQAGPPLPRLAQAILLDRKKQRGFEALVNLSTRQVADWKELPAGVQPAMFLEECEQCERAVRSSAKFQAALARRGIADANLVIVDCWSAGNYGNESPELKSRRLSRPLCFLRPTAADNPYSKPLDGIVALVDLNTSEVLDVQDFDESPSPLPPEAGRWDRDSLQPFRPGIRPLVIEQPSGVSFVVRGREVQWQNWRFRIGFNPREGLTLHAVTYQDGDRERPILHRASICEMVVPYGDPGEQFYRKNAFDIGEYLLGTVANTLSHGCDCLGKIRYFDVDLADPSGQPITIENAICLHEEDAGLLWKHTDLRTEQVEVRRSRRLSVSYIATAGNYDYAFFWHFHQDGSLACEVKLTGVMNTTTIPKGRPSEFGIEIAPQLNAPFHQHVFCARLDMDIDGLANSVQEIDTISLPRGPKNPHGNAFAARVTPLTTEKQAQRKVDGSKARFWRIVSTERTNRLGQVTGYRLMPGENCPFFLQPDAAVAKRAGFAQHQLWVTPHRDDERYAAGEYPNQSAGGDGLPRWTAADRSVAGEDVVLWYVFAHNHVPRVEDWPVMPVSSLGFMLKPDGFFERNPALDLPPPA